MPHTPAEMLILIDDKPLRRTAYAAFLTPWAGERGGDFFPIGIALGDEVEAACPAPHLEDL